MFRCGFTVPRPRSRDRGGLVFFRGGGLVACGLDRHDGLCRTLCNGSGCAVVSVDYGLAPEAQYPLSLEDCYAATCWVADNADLLQVDARRLTAGGDSAGGTLAAAVALMTRHRGERLVIEHQFLLNPALDSACDSSSCIEFGEGYLLTREMLRWFWGPYLGSTDPREPLASPVCVDRLKGLPPATVVSAESDPLRDEAERYADHLKAAGIPVVCKRHDGMIHGFLSVPAIEAIVAAQREIGGWIAQELVARSRGGTTLLGTHNSPAGSAIRPIGLGSQNGLRACSETASQRVAARTGLLASAKSNEHELRVWPADMPVLLTCQSI